MAFNVRFTEKKLGWLREEELIESDTFLRIPFKGSILPYFIILCGGEG